MKTTIDKAGRVVIPVLLREKAGFVPGAEIEAELDGSTIRLVRTAPRPKIVKIGKRHVVQPTADRRKLPKLDIAKLVQDERERWPW